MTNILIVYATDHGNTKRMAEKVAAGAMSVVGTSVIIKEAQDATESDVLAADGIVAGSPVHMSSLDWRVKQFIETVCGPLWVRDALVGKIGAAFVTGGGLGSAGAGCELTMLTLLTNFAECGMILIPLPKTTPGYNLGGLQWAPYGRTASETMEQTGVAEERLLAAFHHGVHIARAAALLSGNGIFKDS
jgi:NAD(P)H dehydrogenase (quinone)